MIVWTEATSQRCRGIERHERRDESIRRKRWPTKSRAIFAGRSRWRFAAASSAARAGRPIAAGCSLGAGVLAGGCAGLPGRSLPAVFSARGALRARSDRDHRQRYVSRDADRRKILRRHGPQRRARAARMRAATRSKRFPGWRRPASSARCPTASAWRSTERTPVAFLRTGNELALVDADGVILDRPLEGDFHFPVVSGFGDTMPLAIAPSA